MALESAKKSCILRISDQKTFQLVELYGEEPCLWNTSLDDYRDRRQRTAAAHRIARQLQIKNFQARHVMLKFKNLRNSYRQELKKIATSVKAVAKGTAARVYRPRVFWFDKMDSFLRPYLQPLGHNKYCSNSKSNVTDDDTSCDENTAMEAAFDGSEEGIEVQAEQLLAPEAWIKQEVDIEDHVDIEEEQLLPPPRIKLEDQIVENKVDPVIIPVKFPSREEEMWRDAKRCKVPVKKVVKKKEAKTAETAPEAAQRCDCAQQQQQQQQQLATEKALREISEQLEGLRSRPDDAFDSFGKYVAALLRGLPPARAALLQPRLVALLTASPVVIVKHAPDTLVTQSNQNL